MLDYILHKNDYALFHNEPTTDEDYYKEPDETVKDIIKTFEERIKREVIKVYEGQYQWLLYTRPLDGSLNFSPYYTYSKLSDDISAITEMGSNNPAWEILENSVYVKHIKDDGRGPYANEYEALYITSEHYDAIFDMCDKVFEIEKTDTVVCEGSREELGTKFFGYMAKGLIDKDDELMIINCDGSILGKVSDAHIDTSPEDNTKQEPYNHPAWVYILKNLYDDCLPVYLVKVSDERKATFDEQMEKIKVDIKETLN